jgi:hypothetical protein
MRGMVAGIVAAGVWAAAEPALGRALGIPWYSDRRLLGGLVRVGPEAAIAIHLANGAFFGATFQRLGLRGPEGGVVMAQAESTRTGLRWPSSTASTRTGAAESGRRSSGTDAFSPTRWPPMFSSARCSVACSARLLRALLLLRFRQRGVELSLDVFVDRSRVPGIRLFVLF